MRLSDRISGWIKQKVQEAGAEGVVVGLSGGVDSSVVAALCKRALEERVLGLIMPCHNHPDDEQDARLIAQELGIKTEKVVLDHIWDEFVKVLPAPHTPLALANLKPRLRMATLYFFANSLNYLVVGSGNKSEISIGYFTKYGDGAADLLPLGGLLKTQVRELAKELNIPEKIINKPPSAGLWAEQTDEKEIGLSYEQLDRAILALQSQHISDLKPKIVSKVKKLMESSQHKRAPIPLFSP